MIGSWHLGSLKSPQYQQVEVSETHLRILVASRMLIEGDWEFKARQRPVLAGFSLSLLGACSSTHGGQVEPEEAALCVFGQLMGSWGRQETTSCEPDARR
jgi:hypothetical protein